MELKILVFLQILRFVTGVWVEPYIVPVDEVRIISDDKGELVMEIDENNSRDFVLGVLTYESDTARLDGNDKDKFRIDTPTKQLICIVELDYEKVQTFKIRISAEFILSVILHLKNVNDNPTKVSMIGESCLVKEEEDPFKTDCKVSLTDADGFEDGFELRSVTFADSFLFTCDAGCGTDLKEDVATMDTLIVLDYEKNRRYTFELEAHDGKFNEREKIEVDVDDVADTAPVWKKIFAFQQFQEKQIQQFQVLAEDGDVKIDDDIFYFCITDQPEITCTDDGYINVAEIDRDVDNINSITFSIVAKERGVAAMETEQSVIFRIDDINDHEPEINLGIIQNKILEFYENKYITLADLIKIDVVDTDFGDNGTYTMSLSSDTVDVNNFFQIIPDSGYQVGEFNLIISNSLLLDYESNTRHFELQITAQEKAEENHKTIETITINLKNWNDESPVFKHDVYRTSVKETIGRKNEEIIQNLVDLYATDKDECDEIEYTLVGSSVQKILKYRKGSDDKLELITIDQADENIQLFDYEKDKEVKFQLEAADTWVDEFNTAPHRVYAEIIISVTDVNDETPTIRTTTSSIKIKENREDNEEIPDFLITGYDADEHHELKFGIDWDTSYATKFGQKVNENFTRYKGCFETVENGDTATLKVVDVIQENTPDYELFDTIYLNLTVEDVNQQDYIRTNEITLIINIENVNDMWPVFEESFLNRQRKVRETSLIDTPVGFILATDEDGLNKLEYFLQEINGTPTGWIDIDRDSGELSVISNDIDAEYNGALECLYYTVIASDGLHDSKKNLSCIKIEDVNDEIPTLIDHTINTALEEHAIIGTEVATFDVEDKDRDSPNNKVVFSLEDDISVKYLHIDRDTGTVTVKEIMDREGPDKKFTVKVRFRDDPLSATDQLSNDVEFEIDLVDINDQEPKIITNKITVSEQEKAGKRLEEKIEATDADDPDTDNAKMEIEIMKIEGTRPLDESFFEIDTPKIGGRTEATLILKQDLRKFFGTYTMTLNVKDFGSPDLNTTKGVTLEVTKYNFEKPVFQFPTDKAIFLKPNQELNTQLNIFNGERLKHIKAVHEVEYKYPIVYSIYERNSPSKIFQINAVDDYEGMLVLIDTPIWEDDYEVTIIAQDEGVPPLNETITTKISFFNRDDEPTYEIPREATVYFKETEVGVGETQPTKKAKYKDESFHDPIYYNIRNNILDAFKVDDNGDLTLIEPIWVLNTTNRVMEIVASKNTGGNTNPASASVLTVYLKLEDLNDNKPVFDMLEDFTGISLTTPYDVPIAKVVATDLDEGTVLEYYMKPNSFQHKGDNLLDTHEFIINRNTGDITINFAVKENMNGYYFFTVMASDGELESEEGIIMTVYIIFNENMISFAFSNSKDEVVEKKSQIQSIMSEILKYDCTIQSITEISTPARETITTGGTEVKAHFTDRATKLPAKKDEIMSKLNNIEIYPKLETAFLGISLGLKGVIQEPVEESNEETLMIALISVSVILGTLLIFLTIGFIIKTRSLSKRLNKLSSVKFSSNESLNVAAAPNTNRRAIEGSNPVFNTSANDKIDYDPEPETNSLSSVDSDLFGIENSSVFMTNVDDDC